MMHSGRAVLIGIVTVCQPSVFSQVPPKPAPPAPPPKHYESPAAVFNAYRVALAKKDTATEIYCHVKEIREDAYRYYIGGGYAAAMRLEMAPGIAAALKKFGVDAIDDELSYLVIYFKISSVIPVAARLNQS